MGAEGTGNASGLAASVNCYLKEPWGLSLPLQMLVSSTFPRICRPLPVMWDSVLSTDKNETQTGQEVSTSWLSRGGQIRQETSGNRIILIPWRSFQSCPGLTIREAGLNPTQEPALTKHHPFPNPGLRPPTLYPGQTWFGPWFNFCG